MISRILCASLAAIAPALLVGQTGKTVLYAAVGNELTQYDLDPTNATLTKRDSVMLPASVQEAWPHPSHKLLYVAWSNGGAGTSAPASGSGTAAPAGDLHGITAFRIDPASGALVVHGKPVSLSSRPIFITTDIDGTHIIAAYNDPSALTVHRILPDGTIGPLVQQTGPLDFGVYGHQVRADPSGKIVILVTRGNGPTAAEAEDPGAVKIFGYKDGVLSNLRSIAPAGGYGYQVRHLDFHPSGKWAFVTLERQNQIHVYGRMPDGTLSDSPLFVRSTLKMDPAKSGPDQAAASIHFHPNGRFVYVANRASGSGGENSIAVFSVNQATGEPTLVQSIDTQGFQPRTFTLNSGGKFLAAANQAAQVVRDAAGSRTVPASIALFRVGADGRLGFAHKYDVETSAGRVLFWAGFVSLP